MVVKYAAIAILIAVCIFASSWCFNHVNSWLGIGMSLALIIGLVHWISKKVKKAMEESEDSKH